jgi:hypothetical protein
MNLNDLLQVKGIYPERVLVLRHTMKRAGYVASFIGHALSTSRRERVTP